MKTAQIFIYDFIGQGGYTAKDFVNDIKDFKENNVDKIELYINSPGGDVFEGFTIFNHLKTLDADAYVMGQAASIASVIASGANKIFMHKNARFLIHNPSTIAWGDEKEMNKRKTELENIKNSIIDAYTKRTDLSKEEIVDMMDEETSMTAKEAKEKGFVDEVISDTQETNYVAVYINYIDDNKNYNKKDEEMNAQVLNFLGLPKDSTDENLNAKITEFKNEFGLDENSTIVDFVAKVKDSENAVTALNNKITTLQNSLDAINQEKLDDAEALKKQEAENLVDDAISNGKILPVDKKVWLNNAIANFDETKTDLDAKEKNSAVPGKVEVKDNIDVENPKAISFAARKYVAEQASIGNTISVTEAVNHVMGK